MRTSILRSSERARAVLDSPPADSEGEILGVGERAHAT